MKKKRIAEHAFVNLNIMENQHKSILMSHLKEMIIDVRDDRKDIDGLMNDMKTMFNINVKTKKTLQLMSFIKKLGEQAFIDNLDAKVVEYIYKESDVYKALDMTDYVLRDDDKLPMSLVDCSKLVNNDYMEMVDCSKYYMERALVSAKQLVVALEEEIKACEDQKQFNEVYPKFYAKN